MNIITRFYIKKIDLLMNSLFPPILKFLTGKRTEWFIVSNVSKCYGLIPRHQPINTLIHYAKISH